MMISVKNGGIGGIGWVTYERSKLNEGGR